MNTPKIRRFIDVIFVEPKHKLYIILHQGEFWQMPRMNLSQASWDARTPYTGNLNDIFVAHNQAVPCLDLAQTLSTYELPEQLSGLSANHFLGWWANNDYRWLSQNNVVELSLSDDDTPTPSTNKKTKKPSPKKVSKADTPKTTQKTSKKPATKATKTNAEAVANASQNQAKPTKQPTAKTKADKADNAKKTDNTKIKTDTKPTQKPTPKADTKNTTVQDDGGDGLDLFDNLLHELNDEVLHPHRQ